MCIRDRSISRIDRSYMTGSFDVVVIGGGPGGYVAALRASQLGAKTAVVERDRVGGTCLVRGTASLAGNGAVDISGERIQAKDIVIATGSAVARIPLKGAELTIDSDQILELKEIPGRLAVIGGGVVGMEFAAMFAALGSKVTVLEMLPQILPMVDADLVTVYAKHLAGLGGEIHTSAKVEKVAKSKGSLQVRFSSGGEGGSIDAVSYTHLRAHETRH